MMISKRSRSPARTRVITASSEISSEFLVPVSLGVRTTASMPPAFMSLALPFLELEQQHHLTNSTTLDGHRFLAGAPQKMYRKYMLSQAPRRRRVKRSTG